MCRNLTCFELSSAVASAASVQRASTSSASGTARLASTATDHNPERAPPSGVASANTVHASVHDAARHASAGKDHTTEPVAHIADHLRDSASTGQQSSVDVGTVPFRGTSADLLPCASLPPAAFPGP